MFGDPSRSSKPLGAFIFAKAKGTFDTAVEIQYHRALKSCLVSIASSPQSLLISYCNRSRVSSVSRHTPSHSYPITEHPYASITQSRGWKSGVLGSDEWKVIRESVVPNLVAYCSILIVLTDNYRKSKVPDVTFRSGARMLFRDLSGLASPCG